MGAAIDKTLIVLLVTDLIYLGTGGILIGLAVKAKKDMDAGWDLDNVAENLLLMHTPWARSCTPSLRSVTVCFWDLGLTLVSSGRGDRERRLYRPHLPHLVARARAPEESWLAQGVWMGDHGLGRLYPQPGNHHLVLDLEDALEPPLRLGIRVGSDAEPPTRAGQLSVESYWSGMLHADTMTDTD